VINRFSVYRFNHRHVIHDAGDVRNQLAHPCAGLAVLAEFENGLNDRKRFLP
jgi:hypothetical protein